jgi:hypothetical protein
MRPPSAEITSGLTTIADKIRALAHADYDRTEISKILGIRYQHVRNVMLRSGLAGGLRREVEAERESVEVDAAPALHDGTSWKVLIDAGFQFIGEWTQDPESLIRLDARAVGVAGTPGQHGGGTGSGTHRDDPPVLEYPVRKMTERGTTRWDARRGYIPEKSVKSAREGSWHPFDDETWSGLFAIPQTPASLVEC